MSRLKLNIAGVIIQLESRSVREKFFSEELEFMFPERMESFFYHGRRGADIQIGVRLVKDLPPVSGRRVFLTTHFQDESRNWRLLKGKNGYIYESLLKEKRQVMFINKRFDRITAYLLPKKMWGISSRQKEEFLRRYKGMVWSPEDIVYDFLQVLLINFFAIRKLGVFTHSVGIKDTSGDGLLFAGRSGAGKSTMARIWHKHSRSKVLNDDRVIIRKTNGRFMIYGSPWHGDFSDYLVSRVDHAPLEKLFFIRHSRRNALRPLKRTTAFRFLFPALFPTFWDKGCLEKIAAFCQDLLKKTRCYDLGFVNTKEVIAFIRNSSFPADTCFKKH